MIDLSTATVEQIKAELARRERAATVPAPTARTDIDMGQVIDMIVSWVTRLANDERHHDDDIATYVFEAAVTAVYGIDAWKWINAKQR